MKKRFIPIICIIYSIIVGYLIFSGKLSYFLAPNMQIYAYISVVPLFVIGLITLFKNSNINIKVTDIILLLPIVMFLFVGDGTLSSSFAKNRANNINKTKTTDNAKKEEQEEVIDNKEEYDFSDVYFDVIDSTYQGLANYLAYTQGARIYSGKTIRVKGTIIKDEVYLNDNLVALGRLSITCCAADAEFSGFFVKIDASKVEENAWYEIEGVLEEGQDAEGYDILAIRAVNIKKVDAPKEKYVYMCSEYGNGTCKDLQKYEFVY